MIWIAVAIVAVLVVIQLVRPAMENPPVDPKMELSAIHPASPDVAGILQRSCNDCHSNRTVWPAYSHLAPASWLIASDVHRGRNAMNLSEWGAYAPERSQKLLRDMCSEVTDGEMPGFSYKLMHPSAKLSTADVQSVCGWTKNVVAQSASGPASSEAAEAEDE